MNSEAYDYLICLSIENTEESVEGSAHRFLYFDRTKELGDVHPETFPSTVEFDWCAYDLKAQIVIEEVTAFVKPLRSFVFSEAVQKRTGIKPSDCENAISLSEMIMKVRE